MNAAGASAAVFFMITFLAKSGNATRFSHSPTLRCSSRPRRQNSRLPDCLLRPCRPNMLRPKTAPQQRSGRPNVTSFGRTLARFQRDGGNEREREQPFKTCCVQERQRKRIGMITQQPKKEGFDEVAQLDLFSRARQPAAPVATLSGSSITPTLRRIRQCREFPHSPRKTSAASASTGAAASSLHSCASNSASRPSAAAGAQNFL